MLKCSRCGQYYIPGYLDCNCRIKGRRHSLSADGAPRDKGASKPLAKAARVAVLGPDNNKLPERS